MGSTLETVVFYFLAAFIVAMSVMTVTTQRIVRSATYLLFVLFGTAGIYFLLGYTFLGSVQIMVYAGGIVVLYVFSILLTSGEGDRAERLKWSKFLAGAVYDAGRTDYHPGHHPQAPISPDPRIWPLLKRISTPSDMPFSAATSTVTYCHLKQSASCCWPVSLAVS